MSEFTEIYRKTAYGYESFGLSIPGLPYYLSRVNVSHKVNDADVFVSFSLTNRVCLHTDTWNPAEIINQIEELYLKGDLIPKREPVIFGWDVWVGNMFDVEVDGTKISFLFRSFDNRDQELVMVGDTIHILTNKEPYISRYEIVRLEIANNNADDSNWLFQKAYGVFSPLEIQPIKTADDIDGEVFEGFA